MTVLSHILGFPRIGLRRELKQALENYWTKKISQHDLLSVGRELRMRHWKQQSHAGIDIISVGDFAWYDHVLTMSLMLGNIPDRFYLNSNKVVDIDVLFRIARGYSIGKNQITASEMKKWFNTNYHYIVPEFFLNQTFQLMWTQLFDEVDEAISLGYQVKVILLGPISYLWLGKIKNMSSNNKLLLLPALLSVYKEILNILSKKNVTWIQIDEPILVLELPTMWRDAFYDAYKEINNGSALSIKLLLSTYFGGVSHNIDIINKIPVHGLHIDLVSGDDDIMFIHEQLPSSWVLSVGVVNGRNIWKTNLNFWFDRLQCILNRRMLWLGSSCSLLHVPIDLDMECVLPETLKRRFAFAIQKCVELKMLSEALNNKNFAYTGVQDTFDKYIFSEKSQIQGDQNQFYKNLNKRLMDVNIFGSDNRLSYTHRVEYQRKRFNLPKCPTTTIGSFPQTSDMRLARLKFKNGQLSQSSYFSIIKDCIKNIILAQEELGLDVFVHGEPERSDMVEYFAEHLDGFVTTHSGWIQSYGSRCVKPPIIIGDIMHTKSITTEWMVYAQSLTHKPVKGMLTGPVTMLSWSFPREDITRESIALQIALAIREEVLDLEKHGIGIIQIDEPAFREGLPLKVSNWSNYFEWAVRAFKLTTLHVGNDIQIHTHMCYSEFNDIVDFIANMDVDVLTIEASRINLEYLDILKKSTYFNEIGLGVYDIHSPNIPSKEDIVNRLKEMIKFIPIDRLWINPDCGLKTRSWSEVKCALKNMISAAKDFRKICSDNF